MLILILIFSDVDIDILMNAEAAVTIDFENVPVDKIDIIDNLLLRKKITIMFKSFFSLFNIH